MRHDYLEVLLESPTSASALLPHLEMNYLTPSLKLTKPCVPFSGGKAPESPKEAQAFNSRPLKCPGHFCKCLRPHKWPFNDFSVFFFIVFSFFFIPKIMLNYKHKIAHQLWKWKKRKDTFCNKCLPNFNHFNAEYIVYLKVPFEGSFIYYIVTHRRKFQQDGNYMYYTHLFEIAHEQGSDCVNNSRAPVI